MSADNLQAKSIEWRIDIPYGGARCVGKPDPEILGDLFAMWLHGKEDVSHWDHAPLFGAIIVENSDLSLPVVSVWIGIDECEIRRLSAPSSGPPWVLEGPDGERLTLNREIN